MAGVRVEQTQRPPSAQLFGPFIVILTVCHPCSVLMYFGFCVFLFNFYVAGRVPSRETK